MTTTMTRFVPFRSPLEDVAVLQNRLNSIFGEFASPNSELHSESLSAGSFIPPVDIYEDGNSLLISLEVAGIPRQDLDISLDNQNLTVRGERKVPENAKNENFHRLERRYGSFVRTFTLPSSFDTGSVQANYDNGVLFIRLSKKEAAKPKQVKIEIGASAAMPAQKQVEGSRPA